MRIALALVAAVLVGLAAGPAAAAPEGHVHERATFAPLYELAFVNGVGRRVEESGLGLVPGYAFSAPYEDVRLRSR